ncbi:MAG: transposase [Ruminococcus sp.]|nr:transposase [Ruminococcus sp.]
MAKSKYDEYVKPYLEQIEIWKKNGATDEQIAKNLGISKVTFYEYVKKHSELSERLKKSKEVFVAELKNSLATLCFKHKLEKKIIRKRQTADGDTVTNTEIVQIEVDPSPVAINMLLKNIDREGKWSDNPQGQSLREQELELKKMMIELENIEVEI